MLGIPKEVPRLACHIRKGWPVSVVNQFSSSAPSLWKPPRVPWHLEDALPIFFMLFLLPSWAWPPPASRLVLGWFSLCTRQVFLRTLRITNYFNVHRKPMRLMLSFASWKGENRKHRGAKQHASDPELLSEKLGSQHRLSDFSLLSYLLLTTPTLITFLLGVGVVVIIIIKLLSNSECQQTTAHRLNLAHELRIVFTDEHLPLIW